MIDELTITKSEYNKILKNRGKHVSSTIDDDALLRRWDLRHLASIRGLVFDDSNLESILYALFNHIHKKTTTN